MRKNAIVRGAAAALTAAVVTTGFGAAGCGGTALRPNDVVRYLVPEEDHIRTTCELLALDRSGTASFAGIPELQAAQEAAGKTDQTLEALRKNDVRDPERVPVRGRRARPPHGGAVTP